MSNLGDSCCAHTAYRVMHNITPLATKWNRGFTGRASWDTNPTSPETDGVERGEHTGFERCVASVESLGVESFQIDSRLTAQNRWEMWCSMLKNDVAQWTGPLGGFQGKCMVSRPGPPHRGMHNHSKPSKRDLLGGVFRLDVKLFSKTRKMRNEQPNRFLIDSTQLSSWNWKD